MVRILFQTHSPSIRKIWTVPQLSKEKKGNYSLQQSCYGIWNEESIDFSLWSARENYQPTSCGNFLGEFAPEWISTSTLVWSKKNPLPHMSIGSWRTSRDTVHWIKGVAEHLISCQVNMFAWDPMSHAQGPRPASMAALTALPSASKRLVSALIMAMGTDTGLVAWAFGG